MKTSILMSVYCKEKAAYFEQSLVSILIEQTIKPDEFVLVCDGPLNEELNSIIAKFEKLFPSILKVFRTEQNQGLGKALNFGLEKCTNEIVIRADSDDICASNRIEIQAQFLEDNPDITVVSSYIDEFDNDVTKPIAIKTLPLNHDELVLYAKFRNPLNHMAVAFRKSHIVNIGSYHHLPYVEDYELWARVIASNYRIANIDKVLVHARVGNGMTKRRGNKQCIKSWRILNQFMFSNNMITKREFRRNMLSIRVFVHMPNFIRKLLYKIVLRKRFHNSKNN